MYERSSVTEAPLIDLRDHWQVVPVLVANFATPGQRITQIECGTGHTMAISQQGDVYSWGEGFEGKLGLGFNKHTRLCEHQQYPKKVTKGLH